VGFLLWAELMDLQKLCHREIWEELRLLRRAIAAILLSHTGANLKRLWERSSTKRSQQASVAGSLALRANRNDSLGGVSGSPRKG
jgi:hypothetical protein